MADLGQELALGLVGKPGLVERLLAIGDVASYQERSLNFTTRIAYRTSPEGSTQR